MEFRDYYEILGVARDVTQDELKRSYRKLARKYHPDVSKEVDAEARFKELGEAYEVLKDPEKRAAYDQLGANWQNGQDFQAPPDWDQGFEFHGGGFTDADAEQFSDFFETLFGRGGGGGPRPGPGQSYRGREYSYRGEDRHAKVLIDIEDAYHGASKLIVLKHSELGPDGRPLIKERKLNVQIPKGVRQGQHIRLAKQGDPGMGGSDAGDLYLEIEFSAHRRYHVEGSDVYLDLPLAPWEAALGATVEVATPAGRVQLKVPPNSQPGRKMRLKGRGIPAREVGDLYVVLQIALPPADSDAARKAYRAFERDSDFDPRAGMGG